MFCAHMGESVFMCTEGKPGFVGKAFHLLGGQFKQAAGIMDNTINRLTVLRAERMVFPVREILFGTAQGTVNLCRFCAGFFYNQLPNS